MPAVEYWDIDKGGDGDYATLALFESNENQDLTSTDIQINAICRSSDSAADTDQCVISGWTMDSTKYLNIEGLDAPGVG
jgi:hypothetical protein